MIAFIIISVLISAFNIWALKRIEKKEGLVFHSSKTGELVSIVNWHSPSIAKVFLVIICLPFINIPFAILYLFDLLNGH